MRKFPNRKARDLYFRNRNHVLGKLFPTKGGHVFVVSEYITNSVIHGNFLGSTVKVTTTLRNLNNGLIKHPCEKQMVLEGTINCSKKYGEMYLENYVTSSIVFVRFLNTGSTTKTTFKAFRSGNVKDYEAPTVYGKGILGSGEFKLSKDPSDIVNIAYKKWSAMLRRVYVSDHIHKDPTYKDCVVDAIWLNFQNFAKWYTDSCVDTTYELDKDLLFKGNKLYSPYTCTLLPKEINTTLTKNDKNRSDYGIGVGLRENGTYRSNSKLSNYYKSRDQAFLEYKLCKEGRLQKLAEKYKDTLSKDAYIALYDYKVLMGD